MGQDMGPQLSGGANALASTFLLSGSGPLSLAGCSREAKPSGHGKPCPEG